MDRIALASPEEVKYVTAVSASSYAFDDPMIKQCLLTASSQISRYCGRDFSQRTVSDIFGLPRSFSGSFSMLTSAVPVAGVVGKLDGVESSIDVLDPATGRLAISVGKRLENSTIKVTYTGGFGATNENWGPDFADVKVLDVPPDIKQACGLQASYLANRFLKNETGKKDGQNRAVGDRTSYSVIPEAAVILAAYVKPKMAKY